MFDAKGDLYFAERDNNVIRKVDMKSGIISTVAGTGAPGFSGDGGPAKSAAVFNPIADAADNSGNVYIADSTNNRIRKVNASGTISTIAGTGSPAFSGDGGPALNAALNDALN